MTSELLAAGVSPSEVALKPVRDGLHPFVEFLLVGGATLVLFPLAWGVRHAFGLSDAEYAFGFLTFYGAYAINDPHFAVTYLLFYKDVRARAFGHDGGGLAQRIRYWASGLVVPLALAAWAIYALYTHSGQALGGMVQLMFLLVGWHYAKQGFGVLAVLSARHGVPLGVADRRAFLAHAFAGWAYAWASPAIAAGEFEEKGVVYSAFAHPLWLERMTAVLLLASSLWLAAVLVAKWRREGARIKPIAAPVAGFLITVWSWTIYSSFDPLLRYAIPALHSIQYLYFVWLLRHNEARADEAAPTFGRPAAVRVAALFASALALGFVLFHAAPALLDGALVPRPKRGGVYDDLGPTPYFAALFVFVNIHHYVMDHVIWRRENPDTRFLRASPQARNE